MTERREEMELLETVKKIIVQNKDDLKLKAVKYYKRIVILISIRNKDMMINVKRSVYKRFE